MKILVTGADGLVGYALRDLCAQDARFVFVGKSHADLRSYEDTEMLFRDVSPTRVVHLAALVGGIGGNMMHSGDFFIDNVKMNINVLEVARKSGVKKLYAFMSTCIFPQDATYPLNAKDLHNGPPHPSNFGYAYAKRMLEVHIRAYKTQYGLEYQTLIPTNVYGPNDNWDLVEGHVAPSLIHKCFLAKSTNSPLVIWGNGRAKREFLYSRDLARIIKMLLESEHVLDQPLIISDSSEVSISDLAKSIVRAYGFKGILKFDSSKPEGQLRKPSDNSTFLKLFPDFKFTSLTEGISETVEWFQNNYPNVRGITKEDRK